MLDKKMLNDEDGLIITRHDCIENWFRSKGVKGMRTPIARPTDVRGKIIYGTNLPLHLVGFAKRAYILSIKNDTDKPFEELTPEDIDKCFHTLQMYEVKRKKVNLDDKEDLKEMLGE